MFLIEIFSFSDVTIDSTEDNSQYTNDHYQYSVVNQVQIVHEQTIFTIRQDNCNTNSKQKIVKVKIVPFSDATVDRTEDNSQFCTWIYLLNEIINNGKLIKMNCYYLIDYRWPSTAN